jgi:integrase
LTVNTAKTLSGDFAMSDNHSTTPAPSDKPAKPSTDFPLFAHATKRWAKKIKGKLHYFGRWDDPQGALRAYQAFLAGEVADKPSRPPNDARPKKPTPGFPLFAHASGQWAKKIRGKMRYFGPWADPAGALTNYRRQAAEEAERTPTPATPTPATPATPTPATPVADGKPGRPYPDFPLFAHASAQWAKKIRGKLYYFGKWDNPQAALDNYLKQKEDLEAGRKPREQTEGTTVKEVVNAFLAAKQALVDSGELAALTWRDYKIACDEIIAVFGKNRIAADLRPDDFGPLRKRMAQKWGPQRLSKTIQFIRCVFKYGYDAELIDAPIRFGPEFKRPSKGVMRRQKAAAGPQLFTATEIRRMIDASGEQLRAMILLGINCGFGNSDCGHLPLSAVDLKTGIIDFPRPKTGIPRRCALWPETIATLRDAGANRPTPKRGEHAGLVFVTRYGDSWHTGTPDGPLSRETGKLLRKLGINGRKRLGFYTLRHTFRTVADESKDQPAVDYIMGHEVPHMSAVYRETISDGRLRAVADHVRKWLFPSAATIRVVE